MITSDDAVKKLKKRGYIARQNKSDYSFFINLGGPKSEINRDDFNGIVLLNPLKNLIFAASQEKTLEFRKAVMKEEADGRWSRFKNVAGPSDSQANRIEVRFTPSNMDTSKMICKTDYGEVCLYGYSEELVCVEDQYNWGDIDAFLSRFKEFSS